MAFTSGRCSITTRSRLDSLALWAAAADFTAFFCFAMTITVDVPNMLGIGVFPLLFLSARLPGDSAPMPG